MKPMLSVLNVSSTDEPIAGSRPRRSSVNGTAKAISAATSRFNTIASPIVTPISQPCGELR